MKITDYAFENLTTEGPELNGETGATAHMLACHYDNGEKFVLTGRDVNGKSFRTEAKSLSGAYNTMLAMWGLHSAWHVRADGSRKLAIKR